MNAPFEVPVVDRKDSYEMFTDYFETNHFFDDPDDVDSTLASNALVETKNRHGRRVRTPEGSRVFGLPIGALIVEDVDLIPQVKPLKMDMGYTGVSDRVKKETERYRTPQPPKYPVTIKIPLEFWLGSDFHNYSLSGVASNVRSYNATGFIEGKKTKTTVELTFEGKNAWNSFYSTVSYYNDYGDSLKKDPSDKHKYSPTVLKNITYSQSIMKVLNKITKEEVKPIKKKYAPENTDIPKFKITKKVFLTDNKTFHSYTGKDTKTGRTVEITYLDADWDDTYTLTVNDPKTGTTETVKNKDETRRTNRTDSNLFKYNLVESDYFMLAERELKKPYISVLYEKFRHTIPNHLTFNDNYLGVYGVHYVHDDDKKRTLVALDDFPSRRRNIAREQESLGIYIGTSSAQEGYTVNFQAQELINGNARAMEEVFPGFNIYQPTYALQIGLKDAIAYNKLIDKEMKTKFQKYDNNELYYSDVHRWYNENEPFRDDSIDWDYTAIGLNKAYFGKKFDYMSLYMSYNQGADWHSIHNESTPKDTDLLDDTEKILMGTLIHETGHTVARICIGEIEPDNPIWNGKDRFNEFTVEIFDVLKKYGATNETGEWTKLSFDTNYFTSLLSTYGSTNFHEFLAESWAEYFFADSPRPLATDVGNIMAYFLDKFIEAEGVE